MRNGHADRDVLPSGRVCGREPVSSLGATPAGVDAFSWALRRVAGCRGGTA